MEFGPSAQHHAWITEYWERSPAVAGAAPAIPTLHLLTPHRDAGDEKINLPPPPPACVRVVVPPPHHTSSPLDYTHMLAHYYLQQKRSLLQRHAHLPIPFLGPQSRTHPTRAAAEVGVSRDAFASSTPAQSPSIHAAESLGRGVQAAMTLRRLRSRSAGIPRVSFEVREEAATTTTTNVGGEAANHARRRMHYRPHHSESVARGAERSRHEDAAAAARAMMMTAPRTPDATPRSSLESFAVRGLPEALEERPHAAHAVEEDLLSGSGIISNTAIARLSAFSGGTQCRYSGAHTGSYSPSLGPPSGWEASLGSAADLAAARSGTFAARPTINDPRLAAWAAAARGTMAAAHLTYEYGDEEEEEEGEVELPSSPTITMQRPFSVRGVPHPPMRDDGHDRSPRAALLREEVGEVAQASPRSLQVTRTFIHRAMSEDEPSVLGATLSDGEEVIDDEDEEEEEFRAPSPIPCSDAHTVRRAYPPTAGTAQYPLHHHHRHHHDVRPTTSLCHAVVGGAEPLPTPRATPPPRRGVARLPVGIDEHGCLIYASVSVSVSPARAEVEAAAAADIGHSMMEDDAAHSVLSEHEHHHHHPPPHQEPMSLGGSPAVVLRTAMRQEAGRAISAATRSSSRAASSMGSVMMAAVAVMASLARRSESRTTTSEALLLTEEDSWSLHREATSAVGETTAAPRKSGSPPAVVAAARRRRRVAGRLRFSPSSSNSPPPSAGSSSASRRARGGGGVGQRVWLREGLHHGVYGRLSLRAASLSATLADDASLSPRGMLHHHAHTFAIPAPPCRPPTTPGLPRQHLRQSSVRHSARFHTPVSLAELPQRRSGSSPAGDWELLVEGSPRLGLPEVHPRHTTSSPLERHSASPCSASLSHFAAVMGSLVFGHAPPRRSWAPMKHSRERRSASLRSARATSSMRLATSMPSMNSRLAGAAAALCFEDSLSNSACGVSGGGGGGVGGMPCGATASWRGATPDHEDGIDTHHPNHVWATPASPQWHLPRRTADELAAMGMEVADRGHSPSVEAAAICCGHAILRSGSGSAPSTSRAHSHSVVPLSWVTPRRSSHMPHEKEVEAANREEAMSARVSAGMPECRRSTSRQGLRARVCVEDREPSV